jgi:hypothetical protein
MFVNIPIIISSSAMSIINSSFAPEDMQIPNICINACTALLIGLINNFKIVETASNFRNVSLKFVKLLHLVDDKLSEENLNLEDVRDITRVYDELLEQIDPPIPNFIKNRVRKMYVTKKYLPIILCEGSQDITPIHSKPASATLTETFAL